MESEDWTGYDYTRVYITNTQSQTLYVYIPYNLNGNKQNIWIGTVNANDYKAILNTHASGGIEVRVSDVIEKYSHPAYRAAGILHSWLICCVANKWFV